jgi:arginine:ornithine antiporter/lysine permease
MLPVEATQQLSDQKLLPKLFGKLNKKNSPANSLWITQIFVQVFLVIAFLLPNSYNLFVYMCTAAIMICYALVGVYNFKVGIQEGRIANMIIGFLAALFQIAVLYWTGWGYIWAVMVLYAIGYAFFYFAKRENAKTLSVGEIIGVAIVNVLAALASIELITGNTFANLNSNLSSQLDLRSLLGTEKIKPGFGKIMGIIFLALIVIFLLSYLFGGRFAKDKN